MRYTNNLKIVKVLKIFKDMTINDDNIIIDNNSNSFINSLNRKNLYNEKRNKINNMIIIT